MRQSGRTTTMLRQALKLTLRHEIVPIMVPSQQVAETLKKKAWELTSTEPGLCDLTDAQAKTLVSRLKFVSQPHRLRGLPRKPILADHSWHESITWILDAVARVKETDEQQPWFEGVSSADT